MGKGLILDSTQGFVEMNLINEGLSLFQELRSNAKMLMSKYCAFVNQLVLLHHSQQFKECIDLIDSCLSQNNLEDLDEKHLFYLSTIKLMCLIDIGALKKAKRLSEELETNCKTNICENKEGSRVMFFRLLCFLVKKEEGESQIIKIKQFVDRFNINIDKNSLSLDYSSWLYVRMNEINRFRSKSKTNELNL